MKIVKLSISNLMRISAVEIIPKGNVITISGKNAQGKTSVLDAIAFALGGAKFICPDPIKEGERKAEVNIELPDYTVKRWWTSNDKSYLKVTAKDGAEYGQGLLDKLRVNLSFDPLEFARMNAKSQRSVLLGIVYLEIDLAKNIGDRKQLFDERTIVNRNANDSQARLAGLPVCDNKELQEEISISALSGKINEANNINNENQKKREHLADIETNVAKVETDIDVMEMEASKLSQRILEKKDSLDVMRGRIAKGIIIIAALKDIKTQEIVEEIESAEETNKSIRKEKEIRLQRKNNTDEAARFTKQADLLTLKITALDNEKVNALSKATFPIEGLSVDEKIVIYNGRPFSQASSSEQLKISLSIAMALNPELRMIRITDGSLLDAENMKVIEEMAKDKDFQFWIEKVTDGENVGIVIEDGMIKK